ncbi:MAG: 50S ribosomal protein L3, partial [Candidatus Thiodiazotropha sp. (ex Dulcina madagascariensis)]|nr:50S ribosomal protein L3 [Candidatus Thiodiazotropha sp. (ex Dulcina madagascariensis)]
MAIGIVGRKAGMTRVFTEQGESVPVTVIEVEPNRVTQLKSEDTEGYLAVQVTTGSRKVSRVNKPAAGHFAKAGVEAGRSVWEFRAQESDMEGLEVGSEIKADLFEAGQIVDVRGRSQGKGFQGGVKRHNFRMQ